jgi:signal transduction histidine kinase/ActR/RegA family two-component response regulator
MAIGIGTFIAHETTKYCPQHPDMGFVAFRGSIASMGTVKDVTELRLAEKERQRLEAQLQHAQKMEAVGTMAGGIAHDFNNLLMGIQGLTSLLMFDIDPAHPHVEHLKEIEDCVKSAADLTKQILGFARGGKYEVKPTDLNELIESNSQMFGRTQKEILIYKEYQKFVWTVEVDQGQIGQVLMNIFVNAWQAMPNGGALSIATANITLDANYVKPFQLAPGRYVKLSVTDTGLGMDENIQKRIFEPFFTTKEMGRGTGLGLATVYGIIKNHGGFIEVNSRKGEGTTFNIYLPATEVEVVEEKRADEKLVRGSETVLFVDDEDLIIDVGEQILKRMGYTVFVARSGKEALEIFSKKKDDIDMVILDMIMPDMSGGEAYDRLCEIHPDIKVLLSSGYSLRGQARNILARGCKGFIQKPFNMRELSHKLREVLEE